MKRQTGSFRLSFLFSSAVAGAAFGVLDAARAALAAGGPVAVAGVWLLDAFSGLLAGVSGIVFLLVGSMLHRILRARPPRAAIDALLILAIAIPLGRVLFSGPGVSQTSLGRLGPILFPLASFLAVLTLSAGLRRIVRPLAPEWSRRRVRLAVAAISAAAPLLLADRFLYPGLYGYLHVTLALATLLLTGTAIWFLLLPSPRVRPTFAFLLFVLLGSLPYLFAFPVDRAQRPLILDSSLIASRTAQAIWHAIDFDGDGFSPLLGGGDCDDTKPYVNPTRLDVTENGLDEDCDGFDPTPASQLTSASYRTDRVMADRIAAAAAGYPTVFILVDALRGDRLDFKSFPNLNRLAKESIRFDRAYATAASTRLSVSAIATGYVLPSVTDSTVATLLAEAGKRAALVSVDVVLNLLTGKSGEKGSGFPFDRGFALKETIKPRKPRAGLASWGRGVDQWTGTEITDRTLALLDGPAPPDFIWVHYFDLHQWPWVNYEGRKASGMFRYDAVLEALDAEIGRLTARADRINIVLTSDHGEGFFGLFHTIYLARQFVHVPLLIRVPGIPPSRVSVPVSLTQVLPTVLQLAGAPGEERRLSRSLLGLAGVSNPGVGSPVLMIEEKEWSVALGPWRLVFRPAGGLVKLFDVESDPAEKKNVIEDYPAVAENLLSLLRTLHAEATQHQKTGE